MKSINEILRDYTLGETGVEDTNDALREAGAGFHLEPGRNEITEADRRETVVGYFPEQASGWGLLDTGIGPLEKVRVSKGRLECAVNEVLGDGTANMAAFVSICGRVYQVLGDRLAEAAEERREGSALPERVDLGRRADLRNMTAVQETRTGSYAVSYDEHGYAVRAARRGGMA